MLDPILPGFIRGGNGFQIIERLDRALVSLDWTALFPMARLFHKSSSVSDHCPLLQTFFEKLNWGRHKKKGFRFEAMWVQDPRCESIVSSAWFEGLVDTSPYPILTCLNSCRSKLEAWNKFEFGHVGKEVARL